MTDHVADLVAAPPLPRGRAVELPGRGTTFVREGGSPSAPTVILLHGLAATASLNWFASIPTLARDYHVVALDHRGHGRGIRDGRRFTLEDAADDAVALADALDIERFVVVGYSMGGPIAQLIWRRHRERLSGIVLCATSDRFRVTPQEHLMYASLPAFERTCRLVPDALQAGIVSCISAAYLQGWAHARWAQRELLLGDQRAVLQAAGALGRCSAASWTGDIDVPAAVLVHCRDQLVPPVRQLALAARLREATALLVDGDHFAPVRESARFAHVLQAAVDDVARRWQWPTDLRAAS